MEEAISGMQPTVAVTSRRAYIFLSAWDREPEFESQQTAIPRYLTDVQEDGRALQFDGARKRYLLTEEFAEDKPNGYSKFKIFWLKRKKK